MWFHLTSLHPDDRLFLSFLSVLHSPLFSSAQREEEASFSPQTWGFPGEYLFLSFFRFFIHLRFADPLWKERQVDRPTLSGRLIGRYTRFIPYRVEVFTHRQRVIIASFGPLIIHLCLCNDFRLIVILSSPTHQRNWKVTRTKNDDSATFYKSLFNEQTGSRKLFKRKKPECRLSESNNKLVDSQSLFTRGWEK